MSNPLSEPGQVVYLYWPNLLQECSRVQAHVCVCVCVNIDLYPPSVQRQLFGGVPVHELHADMEVILLHNVRDRQGVVESDDLCCLC